MSERPKNLLDQAYQEYYAGHYDRALAGFRAVLEHPEASEDERAEAQECITIVNTDEGPGPSEILNKEKLDKELFALMQRDTVRDEDGEDDSESNDEESEGAAPDHAESHSGDDDGDQDEGAGLDVFDVSVADPGVTVAEDAESQDEGAPRDFSDEDGDSLPVPADPFAEMPALVGFGDEPEDAGHMPQLHDELDVMMMADSDRHISLDPSVAAAVATSDTQQDDAPADDDAAGKDEAAQDESGVEGEAEDKRPDQTEEFPAAQSLPAGALPPREDAATIEQLNVEMEARLNRVVELESELESFRAELRNRGSEVQSLHDLVRKLTSDLDVRNREIVELQRRMLDLAEKQQAERDRQEQETHRALEAERLRIASETRNAVEREMREPTQHFGSRRSAGHPPAQTDSYGRLPQAGNGNGSGNGNGNGNGSRAKRPAPKQASTFGTQVEPPRHPTPAVYRSLTDTQRRHADDDETAYPSISAMTTRLNVSTPSLTAPSSSDHMSVYTVSQSHSGQGLVVRTGLRRNRRPINLFAVLGCLGLILCVLLPWHISATNMLLSIGELGQLLSTHRPTISPDSWLSLVDLLWLLPVLAVFLLVWEAIHWGQGYNGHLMHVLVGGLLLGLLLAVFGMLPHREASGTAFLEVLRSHGGSMQLGLYVALCSSVLLILAGLLWPRRRRGGSKRVSGEPSATSISRASALMLGNGSQVAKARSESLAPSQRRGAAAAAVASAPDKGVSSGQGMRARI